LELRHLRYFQAEAEELHFARAAERLHVEQSPLSRAIKELEEELGVVLFARTTRSTRLTRAGGLFLEHVRRVFAALQQARDSVQAAANGFHGQLRVALSDGITPARLPALLALCRQEEPEIEIRFFEVPLSQQIRGLHDDLHDVGGDEQRLGGVAVELKSHLPIERQAHVIGATWLDQQLIGGGSGLGDLGFGGEAKQAMQQRADFVAEQGLAERRGQRVILARNLLGTLRNRGLAQAAKDIAAETGLEHRPVADGQRVAGIYRRSVMLVSGRYAMLDDSMGSVWYRGSR
jgi:ribosomal protein S25